jgi:hypothetical protein
MAMYAATPGRLPEAPARYCDPAAPDAGVFQHPILTKRQSTPFH